MPEIQLLKIQISTTCKLSGRIIVLCKYLWKAGGTNGIMTKNLDKRNSQTPGRQYQTALNTEQQRLPLGYNLQKFYPLLAETECQSENKAQQVCVCVCIHTRVHNSQHNTWQFYRKLPAFGSGKPLQPTNCFNHLKKEIAVEAFDDYQQCVLHFINHLSFQNTHKASVSNQSEQFEVEATLLWKGEGVNQVMGR